MELEERICFECSHSYVGDLKCPQCGISAGEPMDKVVDEPILFADGFEQALIGTARQYNKAFAVYDYPKCVEILVKRGGMDHLGAEEFMEFNVIGGYHGPNTPAFVAPIKGMH